MLAPARLRRQRTSFASRDDDARDAQAEVLLEVGVLGGDDRLAQERGDVVVADDDPALGGELADTSPFAREARDGVRLVVVEALICGRSSA